MAHQPEASSNLGSEPPRIVQAPSIPLSIVVFEAPKPRLPLRQCVTNYPYQRRNPASSVVFLYTLF